MAVSELMLQQTTVAVAAPRFERFVARFPDWDALAAAPAADVLAEWAGLGYYRRARHLHALARRVQAEGGEFPRSLSEALRLPGLGPYTAGAILSLAHGLPVPAVDGNVARVLSRHRGEPLLVTRGADRRSLEAHVMGLQPRNAPGLFNEALMELGATTCTPRQPACASCPVAGDCVARLDDRIADLPPARARRPMIEVAGAAAIIEREGRLLLRRRAADADLLAGLWEFPGGFVPSGRPEDWLAADILSSLGGGRVLGEAGVVRHVITNRRITLRLFRCRLRRMPHPSPDLAWRSAAEAPPLGLTAATARALALLG